MDLGVIFSEVGNERTNLMIGKVTAEDHFCALAYLPKDIIRKIHAQLGDVMATGYSNAAAGMFIENFDVNAFFKGNLLSRGKHKPDDPIPANVGTTPNFDTETVAKKTRSVGLTHRV